MIAFVDHDLVLGLCAWAAGILFVWGASHLRPLSSLAVQSVPARVLALVLMAATLVLGVLYLGGFANPLAGVLTGALYEFVLPTRDRRRRLAAIASEGR